LFGWFSLFGWFGWFSLFGLFGWFFGLTYFVYDFGQVFDLVPDIHLKLAEILFKIENVLFLYNLVFVGQFVSFYV